MGIYGEQLKERQTMDDLSVKKNGRMLAGSVSSRIPFDGSPDTIHDNLRQIGLIADYFRLEVPVYEPGEEGLPELIDLILHPTGIMKRRVLLDGPWWKDSDAPLLVTFREDKPERVLALFPDTFRGYYYRDSQTNRKTRRTGRSGLPERIRISLRKMHSVSTVRCRRSRLQGRNSFCLCSAGSGQATFFCMCFPRFSWQ